MEIEHEFQVFVKAVHEPCNHERILKNLRESWLRVKDTVSGLFGCDITEEDIVSIDTTYSFIIFFSDDLNDEGWEL